MVSLTLEANANPPAEVELFDDPAELSAAWHAQVFFRTRWDAVRNSGVAPRWAGPIAGDGLHRPAFLEAAKLMGLDPEELKPQQLTIADALAGPQSEFVIEAPRRSSKSTSIFLALFGRCLARPGHRVAFTAQSGVIAGRMFLEWARTLDRVSPPLPEDYIPGKKNARAAARARHVALFGDDDLAHVEDDGPPFRIYRAAGAQRIECRNGSVFAVVKPDPEAFRSQAFDDIWMDEAQEYAVEDGDDLLAGALPTMDTRPDARLIISGTAGEAKAGLLWDYLKRLREGTGRVGGCDWAVDPLVAWQDIEDTDTAMNLLAESHPGLGTLTTTERMRERYEGMRGNLPKWAREYLSLWPETSSDAAIDSEQWQAAALAARPRKPDHPVAAGLAIAHGGASAALAVAWRSSHGHAHVEIIDHRTGTKWIATDAPDKLRRARASLAVDYTPEAAATVSEIERQPRAPRIERMSWRELNAACVQWMRELERGTLRHQDQPPLNAAAEAAVKYEMRGQSGAWLFRGTPGSDITPLVAAVVALRNWDLNYARARRSRRAGLIIAAD